MVSEIETASPESLTGEGEAAQLQPLLCAKKGIQQHLLKISRQKADSGLMCAFLLANRDWMAPQFADSRSLDVFSLQIANSAAKLAGCGAWLLFGEHRQKLDVELLQAQFCQQTYLCLFCQARRSYRNITAYQAKLRQVETDYPGCSFLLATFTIPNTADLAAGIQLQKTAFRKLWDRQKQRGTGPLAGAMGAVYSVEITGGADTLWHPHMHAILAMKPESGGFVSFPKLRAEWCALTGGRQIRIDRMHGSRDLNEALKYTVKPQQAGEDGLGLLQRAKVWGMLAGKRIRMLQPYGVLKGIPDELPLDQDFSVEDYTLFFYRWLSGEYIAGEVDLARLKRR